MSNGLRVSALLKPELDVCWPSDFFVHLQNDLIATGAYFSQLTL